MSHACYYSLTISVEKIYSWEANIFPASREVSFILWNMKVCCCVHKGLALFHVLSQVIPFCCRPYFFKIHFYTVLPSLIFLANEKQNILTQIIVSFLRLNLLLIYLCSQFWFVTIFSKNFNLLFFQRIYYLSLCCDFVQNSVDKIWTYTLTSESLRQTNIHTSNE